VVKNKKKKITKKKTRKKKKKKKNITIKLGHLGVEGLQEEVEPRF